MSCIKFLYHLCSTKYKKNNNNSNNNLNKNKDRKSDSHNLLQIMENQYLRNSNSSYENCKTIRKRRHSFPMHPSCSFIFKNDQYENSEISLFTDRAIKHHNETKHGEKQ